MNLRALYVSKLAKCPLTCLADLADDLNVVYFRETTQPQSEQ
jgi:hypothetical protein